MDSRSSGEWPPAARSKAALEPVAIIPARGGSRGVPRKNLRRIDGLSLIARTVQAAYAAERIGAVYVSTDDAEIAAAAAAEGAEVVWRPAEISGDVASSESALIHALGELASAGRAPERFAFLQCTSPFTTGAEIDRCVAALDDPEIAAAFAAKLDHGFYWEVGPDGRAIGVNHDETKPRQRRQDLAPQYRETGSIYVMRTAAFLKAQVRFCGPTVLAPIDGPLIEIDTAEDLAICEAIAAQIALGGEPPALAAAKALALDFDGVLTDDRVLVLEDGREGVMASRSDGLGLERLRKLGLPLLILSKEVNPVVSARGAKLNIEVLQGRNDKLPALTAWLAQRGLNARDVAYIGNDINDLPCLRAVGYPIAPADAQPQARAAASYVTRRPGGFGAVREVCDLILAARGDQDE